MKQNPIHNFLLVSLIIITLLFSGCIDAQVYGTSNNVSNATSIKALQANDTYFNGTVNETILRNYTAHTKVGSFTRDTSLASGTQAVTGVGFKPSSIDFIAFISSTNKTSWGYDDGVESLVMYYNANTGVYAGTTQSIAIVTSATVAYSGKVQSFSDDGFTVTWTKTGLPTGTASIIYKAYR